MPPTASTLSSRQASLARAKKRVKADKVDHARRQPRLSLPSTIESSTVATEDKAKRRQSLRRRQSDIANFKKEQLRKRKELEAAKENSTTPAKGDKKDPNMYSPPLTRSAKKAKGPGSLFSFSPPDQKLNARREREARERAEAEQYVTCHVLCVALR